MFHVTYILACVESMENVYIRTTLCDSKCCFVFKDIFFQYPVNLP